ncbi:MAG: FtsX-like permease family protein, partial [Candidatus Eisenbacteria bacterium]|nr:FtsX-like permease family protein [Candidatus Eisenbacteria bacterium]
MGMKGRSLVSLFVAEGGTIGLMGGIAGVGLGGVLNYLLSVHGLDLKVFTSVSIPLEDSILYAQFSWSMLVSSLFLGVTVAVAASLYPSYMATRLQPAEVLRDA